MRITQQDREMAHKVFVNSFQRTKSDEDIFYELLFCICAPQTTFKSNIKVINKLREIDYYHFTDNKFYLEGGEQEFLWEIVKPVRFYKNKTKWVMEARQKFPEILWRVRYLSVREAYNDGGKLVSYFLRNWLVKNVKGLGMKTASHFLRNLGASDLAIIDTHILKFLGTDKKWKYAEEEERLIEEAKKHKLPVAELDIIIWKYYSKTPWEDYVY